MNDKDSGPQQHISPDPLNKNIMDLHRAFTATRNPIFAWQLVVILLDPANRRAIPLPDWLADYLLTSAWEVITPAMSHAHLGLPVPRAEVWARALGLIRERWNAADDFAKRLRELEDLHHWNALVSEFGGNLPAGVATEVLAGIRKGAGEKIDTRSLQRRLAKARKVFGVSPAGGAVKRRGRLIPK